MTIDWSRAAHLILALGAGFLTGLIHFTLLWYSTRMIVMGRWGLGKFHLSYWGRLVLSGSAFYLISGADPLMLVVCVIGFTVARFAVKFLANRFSRPHEVRADAP